MPRSSHSRSDKPQTSRLANQLVRAAKCWFTSESRYEETQWEAEIQTLLTSLLSKGRDRDIERALETLTSSHPDAAGLVLELAQYLTEFTQVEHDGQQWDCLLMSAPLLAWTRYSVPAVTLKPEVIAHLVEGLKHLVLAPGVNVHCMPKLLSPIEMPLSYPQIRHWLQVLSDAAIKGKRAGPPINEFPKGLTLLADPRHLILVATVPAGQPILRWIQDPSVTREQCLKKWQAYCENVFTDLFAGCQIEVLLPNTYHSSNDMADRKIRSVGIRASLDWMQSVLNVPASDMRATVMAFGDELNSEYRIGYSIKGKSDVLYGTVWPVFMTEEDVERDAGEMTELDEIAQTLKSTGIGDIRFLPGMATPEYCSDCSAPLFPNPQGEIVHAEMPDEALDAPHHFH